jgi:hypothetical protein
MLVLVRDGKYNDRAETPFRGYSGEKAVRNPAHTDKAISQVYASFIIAITPNWNVDGRLELPPTVYLSDICDVVLRLLAASVVHSVLLRKGFSSSRLPNAPSLAYLMEQCQSLKVLTLQYLEMDESHCRLLGNYSRPGLKIELIHCTLRAPERLRWQRS